MSIGGPMEVGGSGRGGIYNGSLEVNIGVGGGEERFTRF